MNETVLKLDAPTKQMFQRLKVLADPAFLDKQFVSFFDRQGSIMAGRIVLTSLAGGNGLRRRTGSLARSIIGRGEIFKGLPAIRVGSLRGPALKYVAVQEYGTVGKGGTLPTIVPKATMVKNLAIPLPPALYPTGVPKKPSPGYWGPLKFIPFKNRKAQNAQGALFTMAEWNKIKKAIKAKTFNGLKGYKALYLLVRKIDIAPKNFLRKGFEAYLPDLNKALVAFIKALFFGAGGKVA